MMNLLEKNLGLMAIVAIKQLYKNIIKNGTSSSHKHIMFSIVDHYEPYHGDVDDRTAVERVNTWEVDYPLMADQHRDADGKSPQHTWFYPPHLDHKHLQTLVNLSHNGYGEVEMHLHHNHMAPFPDTSETLKLKILKCIDDYSKYGVFCLPDGRKTFAFVHGDWSLDNACGEEICGVNDEITILKECGCYADFTFPTVGKAQPSMMNNMFYAKDDPSTPKSYDTGKEVVAGGSVWGDLMLITGILGVRLKRIWPFPKISFESSDLDGNLPPDHGRIDFWVNNAVTVKGQPNWLFIKLHVHGAIESAWSGQLYHGAHDMFRYLESQYNDGKEYKLHYVSAREMYNIVKAAEAGMLGDPNEYRDFEIPRYVYLG